MQTTVDAFAAVTLGRYWKICFLMSFPVFFFDSTKHHKNTESVSGEELTLSHIHMLSDASAADDF